MAVGSGCGTTSAFVGVLAHASFTGERSDGSALGLRRMVIGCDGAMASTVSICFVFFLLFGVMLRITAAVG